MYFGLFKIQILNRRRIGYLLQTPKVIVRRQNWVRFLHFITLKQMNQNIKALGQQITVDKLRLKAVNYKNHLRSEVYSLANLNSNALLERCPHWWHLQREAHPNVWVSARCRKQVSIFSWPQNTEDKHYISSQMKTEWITDESSSVCHTLSTIWQIWERITDDRKVGREVLWVKAKENEIT